MISKRLAPSTSPPIQESARHHLLSGAIGKSGALLVQVVQAIWLAAALGKSGFGEYATLTVLLGIATATGNACVSSFQNVIVDELRASGRSPSESRAVWMNIVTSGAFSLVVVGCTPWLANYFGTFMVLGVDKLFNAWFVLTCVCCSASLQLVATLSARGASLELSGEQTLSKVVGLIAGFTAFYLLKVHSARWIFVIVQIAAAVRPLWVVANKCESTSKVFRKPSTPEFATFSQFYVINCSAALQKVAENSSLYLLGGLPLIGLYGIAQRVFNALTALVQASLRNLWPYWRRTAMEDFEGVLKTANRIRLLQIGIFVLAAGGCFVAAPLVLRGYRWDTEGLKLFAVAWVAAVCTTLSAVSFNVFGAFGKQRYTLRNGVLVLMLSSLIWFVYRLNLNHELLLLMVPYAFTLGLSLRDEISFLKQKALL